MSKRHAKRSATSTATPPEPVAAPNGKHLVRGDGLTMAAFRHRTSRAGNLQLHTHAVVANTTTAQGRETALDGRGRN
jgi:conjugative relaxase-like TrwC/TraI family protein